MNAASFCLLFHRTSSAIPAQLEASHSAKLLKIVHKTYFADGHSAQKEIYSLTCNGLFALNDAPGACRTITIAFAIYSGLIFQPGAKRSHLPLLHFFIAF